MWLTSRLAPVSCYCAGHSRLSQALPLSSVGRSLAWWNEVLKFSFQHFMYFYASKKSLYFITHKAQYFRYFTFLFLAFLMSLKPNSRYAVTVDFDVRDDVH